MDSYIDQTENGQDLGIADLETKDVCGILKLNYSQKIICKWEIPCRHRDLRMAQIPEQPELERPKTTPGTRDGSQSLNTRGFKSMKTAGTVKFQSASGSGPLGATRKKCWV
jgi:hypothetical protein